MGSLHCVHPHDVTSDFPGFLGEESKAEEEEASRIRGARARAAIAKVA